MDTSSDTRSTSSSGRGSAAGAGAVDGDTSASGDSAAGTGAGRDVNSGSGSNPSIEQQRILEPGTKLGGFEIRSVLGKGGMSIVYRGIQLSLNRPVAIKVLHPRFAQNASFIRRFDLEAGALANLNHPNIVNIIDKGVADGQYYFVMELVHGINLEQLLQSVALNERQYTHVINEVSKALTYVHSRGIVHRDIKPSNILVDRHGLVKVGDFGIAHITGGAATGKARNIGTAQYMAPEQASNAENVDARADVYALAVTFYKMFTKQLPGEDMKRASLINTELPRTVDGVLYKAMQPNPAERYATVQEFCSALIEAFKPAETGTGKSETFMFNPSILSSGGAMSASGSGDSSGSFLMPGILFHPEKEAEQEGTGAGAAPTPPEVAAPEPPANKHPKLLWGVGIAMAIMAGVLIALLWYLWIGGAFD